MAVSTPAPKRFLKRWARRLFVWGARLGPGSRRTAPALRVLTYHRIVLDGPDPFSVDPGEFSRQMEKVAASCRVLPLEKALEGLERGASGSPLAALTFDDGTVDFLQNGLPVLSRLGLPATLYVSAGLVGTEGYLMSTGLGEMGMAQHSGGSSEGLSIFDTDDDPDFAMARLIRHRAFGDPNAPQSGVARGSIILISAGEDGIYFSRRDGPGTPEVPVNDISDPGIADQQLDEYDDILIFAGS